MPKGTFKLNSAGLVELMKSSKMQDVVQSAAAKVVSNATSMTGYAYESKSGIGRDRAYGRVYTADKDARKDNLENNTLLKALESVRV